MMLEMVAIQIEIFLPLTESTSPLVSTQPEGHCKTENITQLRVASEPGRERSGAKTLAVSEKLSEFTLKVKASSSLSGWKLLH